MLACKRILGFLCISNQHKKVKIKQKKMSNPVFFLSKLSIQDNRKKWKNEFPIWNFFDKQSPLFLRFLCFFHRYPNYKSCGFYPGLIWKKLLFDNRLDKIQSLKVLLRHGFFLSQRNHEAVNLALKKFCKRGFSQLVVWEKIHVLT